MSVNSGLAEYYNALDTFLYTGEANIDNKLIIREHKYSSKVSDEDTFEDYITYEQSLSKVTLFEVSPSNVCRVAVMIIYIMGDIGNNGEDYIEFQNDGISSFPEGGDSYFYENIIDNINQGFTIVFGGETESWRYRWNISTSKHNGIDMFYIESKITSVQKDIHHLPTDELFVKYFCRNLMFLRESMKSLLLPPKSLVYVYNKLSDDLGSDITDLIMEYI